MGVHLVPGQTIKRSELQDRYGGRRQGGISPSKQTPNVFLFTDQARGAIHGYIYDGQSDDGLYHYTGEGQAGDQRMVQGNRAIRDHRAEGPIGPFEAQGHGGDPTAPGLGASRRRKVSRCVRVAPGEQSAARRGGRRRAAPP